MVKVGRSFHGVETQKVNGGGLGVGKARVEQQQARRAATVRGDAHHQPAGLAFDEERMRSAGEADVAVAPGFQSTGKHGGTGMSDGLVESARKG